MSVMACNSTLLTSNRNDATQLSVSLLLCSFSILPSIFVHKYCSVEKFSLSGKAWFQDVHSYQFYDQVKTGIKLLLLRTNHLFKTNEYSKYQKILFSLFYAQN